MKEGVQKPCTRLSVHDLRACYAITHKREPGQLPELHKNPDVTPESMTATRYKMVKRKAL